MNQGSDENKPPPPIDNIIDLVEGLDDKNPIEIEIAVTADNKVVLFHDKHFKREIEWFEYNLDTSKLDFVFDGGEVRDVVGMALAQRITKYMQNAHQILTVFMDDKTGEAKEGKYIPLIVH